MKLLFKKIKKKWIFLIVVLFLILVPFFWLKPNEIDMGGDSTRLYFYDPLSYLKNYSFYAIEPMGTGHAESNVYILPIMLVFLFLKNVFNSPYLVISFFNSFKLVSGFIFIYLIIKELIDGDYKNKYNYYYSEIVGVLSGLFYAFSRGMVSQWNLAYLSQDQFFLNPLIFYLFLKYFLTRKTNYLWFVLITTFIFAHSFSWASAPAFFSFYPLSMSFLVIYVIKIRKIKLSFKSIFIGLFIFFGLNAFHLLPAVSSLFNPGSNTNTRIFNKENIASQLDYFFGVLSSASLTNNIFIPSFIDFLPLISIAPFVVIFGFIFKNSKKIFLLTGVFFLITLYLLSAKIGDIGIKFYKMLFLHMPAFSMFRNFIFQWLSVYSFFYALLFGQALFIILLKIPKKYFVLLFFIIGVSLSVNAWPFINGSLTIKNLYRTQNITNAVVMDPKYEDTLRYLRSLPDDSKILTLPFTDYNYQVVHGKNNSAYSGLSTISLLAGKKDFAGYATVAPFSAAFMKIVKDRKYLEISQMLGLLNIKYIFYNKDPLIYDSNFPTFPYEYMRNYFPNSQNEYSGFVSKLSNNKIFQSGPYSLYKIDDKYFLPHFYIPSKVISYKNNLLFHQTYERASSFFPSLLKETNSRLAFLDNKLCTDLILKNLCKEENSLESENSKSIPSIYFEKLNPTKYKVIVRNMSKPFTLVFLEAFDSNWKVYLSNKTENTNNFLLSYFNGEVKEGFGKNIFLDENTFETFSMKNIIDNNHFQVNSYANAWYIRPDDVMGKNNYMLIIEMTQQRTFYVGIIISFIFFIIISIWGIKLFIINRL